MRAMEKDRNRRYASANDLAADINRHLTHEPVQAGRPSAAYRFRKLVQRNKGAVAAVAAIVVCLVAGIIGTTIGLLQAQQSAAQLKKSNAQLQTSTTHLEEANSELERSNQQLRQILLHQAFAAATDADRDQAEHLIGLAQAAGAVEPHRQFVLGLLERCAGRPAEAVEALERASEFEETQLIAKCELALTYLELGKLPEYWRLVQELMSAEPETAEEHLFLGLALHIDVSARSADLVRRSLEMHDSPFARLIYAIVLTRIGTQARDAKQLEAAIRELGRAELQLGSDRTWVAGTKLFTFDAYIALARAEGREISDHFLEAASTCAARLRDNPNPHTCGDVAHHYSIIENDPAEAERAWTRAVERSHGDLFRIYHAGFLMRQHEIDRAIEELSKSENSSNLARIFKGQMLALTADGRGEAALIWQQHLESGHEKHWAILLPLLLGTPDELEAFRVQWPDAADGIQLKPKLDYFTGAIGETEFLTTTPYKPTARYCIAMKRLSEGGPENQAAARKHLNDIINSGDFSYMSLFVRYWAEGILAEMDRNPGWPELPVSDN